MGGEQRQVVGDDAHRQRAGRAFGVHRRQLREQALAQVARAEAGRVEGHHELAQRLQPRRRQRAVGRLQGGQGARIVLEVAGVVDLVDQPGRAGDLPRVGEHQRKLLAHVLADVDRRGGHARDRAFLVVAVAVDAAAAARTEGHVGVPAVVGDPHLGDRLGLGLRLGDRQLVAVHALDGLGLAGLGLLEHGVGVQRLADVRFEFGTGQLQEPDRLQQLRGDVDALRQLHGE